MFAFRTARPTSVDSCRSTAVAVPATVSAPTWTFTHAPPPGILLPTVSPTRREPPTWTPTPRSTVTPVSSASPVWGPFVTRTLAPPAECSPPGNPLPMEMSFHRQEVVLQIERYFDTGGSVQNLRATLAQSLAKLDPEARFSFLSVADIDVTGDGVADAVVSFILESPSGEGLGFLSVFGCWSGQMDVLMTESFSSFFPFLHIATHDLNADGVPEIVYSIELYDDQGSATSVLIREWDGHGFRQLVVPPESRRSPYSGADTLNLIRIGRAEISDVLQAPEEVQIDSLFPDTDGNGTREVILTGGGRRDNSQAGPQRLVVDTWSWNGEAFTLADSRFEPPEYRFQAVRDGDAAFVRGRLDEALGFYRQSLDDPKLRGWSDDHLLQYVFHPTPGPPEDPAERTRLAAYAQFRILLVYAVQGREPEAQSLFDLMVGQYPAASPGYTQLQMATRFYEALRETGVVAEACGKARAFAEENAKAVLAPMGSQYYGYLYEDYTPETICPVH